MVVTISFVKGQLQSLGEESKNTQRDPLSVHIAQLLRNSWLNALLLFEKNSGVGWLSIDDHFCREATLSSGDLLYSAHWVEFLKRSWYNVSGIYLYRYHSNQAGLNYLENESVKLVGAILLEDETIRLDQGPSFKRYSDLDGCIEEIV